MPRNEKSHVIVSEAKDPERVEVASSTKTNRCPPVLHHPPRDMGISSRKALSLARSVLSACPREKFGLSHTAFVTRPHEPESVGGELGRKGRTAPPMPRLKKGNGATPRARRPVSYSRSNTFVFDSSTCSTIRFLASCGFRSSIARKISM
jgi:hypothetical protein